MSPQENNSHPKLSPKMWIVIGLLCYLIPIVVLWFEHDMFGSWPLAQFLGPEGLQIVRFVYYPILRLIS